MANLNTADTKVSDALIAEIDSIPEVDKAKAYQPDAYTREGWVD